MLKHPILLLAFLLANSANSQEIQSLVNPETGASVERIRAYWDANIDIANKKIQCEYYEFDSESSVFLISDGRPRYHSPFAVYLHLPLPANLPPVNSVVWTATPNDPNGPYRPTPEVVGGYMPASLQSTYPVWTVTDGVYEGITVLSSSRFVELIARDSAEVNSVRLWQDDARSYFDCFDTGSEQLVPTGSPGQGNTNLIELEDFTFEFPRALGGDEDYPVFVNQETGENVELARGLWSYNSLAGSKICSFRLWNGEAYAGTENPFIPMSQSYFHPYNGNGVFIESSRNYDNSFVSSNFIVIRDIEDMGFDDLSFLDSWQCEGQRAFSQTGACGLEITDSGYRLWETDDRFYECESSSTIQPIAFLAIDPPNCHYTDSDLYEGWGWNAFAGAPCPPIFVDNNPDTTGDANTTDTDGNVNASENGASENGISNGQAPEGNTENINPDAMVEGTVSVTASTADNSNASQSTSVVVDMPDESSTGGGGSTWSPLLVTNIIIPN